jgi:lipoprotein NlpD
VSVRQAVGQIRLAGLSAGLLTRLLGLVLFWYLAGCAVQAPAPISVPRVKGIYHVVKPGENLYRIGKAYDVPHEELARVNRLRNPTQIHVGQTIFIPEAVRRLPVESSTSTENVRTPLSIPDASLQTDIGLVWPIAGNVSSFFGRRGVSHHDGIDIAAEEGTPIKAIGDGDVIYSDRLRGYGNLVILRHDGGLVSVYAHNQLNLVGVGQVVSQGDVIATVGSTGRVSGSHLHLEIRKDNVAQDPLLFLPRLCCREASDMVSPKTIADGVVR